MSKTSYRSIAKANTILGSVGVFSIAIGIIRSKLVAVLLGPAGVGLMGLFQSTIELVQSATHMGIQTSAVRDVAIASESGVDDEICKTKAVVSRVVWLTGLLGLGVMLFGAPWLSELTFGNRDHVWDIRILSIVPLITQLTVQHIVVLQGMRALKRLAMAGVWGGLVGLFVNVPLFFIWGEKAVVPALIVLSVASFIIAWYNATKLGINKTKISWKEAFTRGKGMVTMGFLLGLSSMLDMSAVYIIKIFIQRWGSVAEVGLYTAGFAVVNSYVSLIFKAISTDYYPRLSAASNNKEEYCDVINKQFEIMILALTPMVLLFMSFSSELLYILYSSKFVAAKMMISWFAFGMLFRAYSWCPGYMYLAKRDSKLYFVVYILAFVLELLLFLSGYYLLGLTGVGIAFGLQYFISNSYGLAIIKHRYGFKYGKLQNGFMLFSILCGGAILSISYLIPSLWRYAAYIVVILLATLFCVKELNKRLDIKVLISKKIKKRRI